MIADVRHNPTKHRYELLADGRVAGFATYRYQDDNVLFLHTVVDEAYRGQGLAHQLVSRALADVRAQGRTAIAVCPFVAAVLERRSELTA